MKREPQNTEPHIGNLHVMKKDWVGDFCVLKGGDFCIFCLFVLVVLLVGFPECPQAEHRMALAEGS